MQRRTLGRIAVGAAGPVALVALSGATTPVYAATEPIGSTGCNVTALNPTYQASLDGVLGSGLVQCNVDATYSASIVTKVQKLLDGSYQDFGTPHHETDTIDGPSADFYFAGGPCANLTANFRTHSTVTINGVTATSKSPGAEVTCPA